MSNPISDLYIKFMKFIEPYINKFPYLFGILVGLLFVLAAIFKWNWLLNPNASNFMLSVYEIFGETGVRIFTGIFGAVIALSCIIVWITRK